MKKQLLLPLLFAGVLAVVLVSHCGKSSYNSSSSSNNNTHDTTASANTITMQNMSFSPASLTISSGTTVTWKNIDNTTHTVTADDNSFNSGDMTPGNSYSKTFNTKGSFPYHCIYHSPMKATIVVN